MDFNAILENFTMENFTSTAFIITGVCAVLMLLSLILHKKLGATLSSMLALMFLIIGGVAVSLGLCFGVFM